MKCLSLFLSLLCNLLLLALNTFLYFFVFSFFFFKIKHSRFSLIKILSSYIYNIDRIILIRKEKRYVCI